MNRNAVTLAAAAAIALSLAACGKSSNVSTQSAAASSAPAAGGTVLVTKGTTFSGKLGQEISSKKNHDGDTFTLTEQDTLFHQAPALHGAVIDGHLENVQAAGLGKKPGMTIVFDDIKLADGTSAPISVKVDNIGTFDAKSHHLRTVGLMIGGAMAGHMAAGAHHGGVLGAAGGYMLSQQMKTDIDVKPGTIVVVKFVSDAVSGSASAASDAPAAPEASPSGM
jgi:hypothetical protein